MIKRPIELRLRLSRQEAAYLDEKVKEAGISRNMFLVRLITGMRIYPRKNLDTINDYLTAINRKLVGISTNLNQMAKLANTFQEAPTAEAVEKLQKEIAELNKMLRPLWDWARRNL